jgi:N6-L-threonylcarbamoyladenine synthase
MGVSASLSSNVYGGAPARYVFSNASTPHAARDAGLAFVAPPLRYCTDNAAMIAWAGLERLALGQRDGLDFAPRPRWPLAEAAP